MREELIDALRGASVEQIADALGAAIRAAYTSTPGHGYAAAIDTLRHKPEPAAAASELAEAAEAEGQAE